MATRKIISLQINVSKIEKERLYEGKKGKYLNAILSLNDEPDEYGNHGFIAQSVSKEEREQGVKGEILGNAKELWSDNPQTNPQSEPVTVDDSGDDLPFTWLLVPFAYSFFELVNVGVI